MAAPTSTAFVSILRRYQLLEPTQVEEVEQGDLTHGNIGLQSEGAEIHFRNIRLKQQE